MMLARRCVRVAVLASLIVLASGLPAAAAAETGGWIPRTTISRVVVHDWQTAVFVFFSTPPNNPDNCTDTTSTFVVLQKSHGLFKELYASALAASLSRTSVGGFLWGCDPQFNRPVLLRLDLLPDPNVSYP